MIASTPGQKGKWITFMFSLCFVIESLVCFRAKQEKIRRVKLNLFLRPELYGFVLWGLTSFFPNGPQTDFQQAGTIRVLR